MTDAVNVTILKDSVRVPNGLGGTKLISHQEFLRVFNNTISTETQEAGFGMKLPSNAISLSQTPTEMTFILYYPESRQTLKFETRSEEIVEVEDCAFPAIYISVKLVKDRDEWVMRDPHWFTGDEGTAIIPPNCGEITNGSIPGTNKSLYRLPLPNIFDNNTMCHGGNLFITRFKDDFTGLNELYDVTLLGSPFNNDLNINTKTSVSNRIAYFEWLATQPSFPYGIIHGHPGPDVMSDEEEIYYDEDEEE